MQQGKNTKSNNKMTLELILFATKGQFKAKKNHKKTKSSLLHV